MKKFVAIVLSALMVCALFANGTEETASAGFKPTKDVSWVCTSKPGGGSDIFTTQIKDAMESQMPTSSQSTSQTEAARLEDFRFLQPTRQRLTTLS